MPFKIVNLENILDFDIIDPLCGMGMGMGRNGNGLLVYGKEWGCQKPFPVTYRLNLS